MELDVKPLVGDRVIKNLFESSSRSRVFICDDEQLGYSRFIHDTNGLGSNKVFSVRNNGHKTLTLMRIDGILFDRTTKCDCGLMYESEFDFLELKTSAANKTDKSMDYQYSRSYDQLKSTIQRFDCLYGNANDSFRSKFENLQAYAVFNPTVPSGNASQKLFSARFLKEVRIRLSFTNYKDI